MHAVGQAVNLVITIKDASHTPITGLTVDDFDTLEAYLATNSLNDADVTIDEIDEGQYNLSFIPDILGDWALHYVYVDLPTYIEDTKIFAIEELPTITVTMTNGIWTYSADLTDPIQEVRFLIQDTDSANPLFSDAEVSYALGKFSSAVRKSGAYLVERLIARYAQMADTSELDLSVHASQLYDHAVALLATLNNPFSGGASVIPFAGGISDSDFRGREANVDRIPGIFDRPARVSRWTRNP